MTDEFEIKDEEQDKEEIEGIEIKSLEEWPAAYDRDGIATLINHTGKTLKFKVNPISFEDQVAVGNRNTRPELSAKNPKDPSESEIQDYQLQIDNYRTKVATEILDICWEYKIPGDSIKAKHKWVLEQVRNIRDIEYLQEQIWALSGFKRFHTVEEDEEIMATPDSWSMETAQKTKCYFAYETNFIFYVGGVSTEEAQSILRKCKVPDPPMKEVNISKVHKKLVKRPDREDPEWLNKCLDMDHLCKFMMIMKALGMSLGDATPNEILKFFRARPYWEVVHMYNFATKGKKSYQDHLDFFSSTSALKSL